jgi:hypothetical protein
MVVPTTGESLTMALPVFAYSPTSDAATLSGGSWTTGLPLANLQTEKLEETARSTNALAASTQFQVAYATAQAVDAVIVGPGNFTAAMTYRVRGSTTTTFTTPAYDSGTLSLGVAAADIDPDRGPNIVLLLPSTQTLRYWLVEIFDTANPAGYVEIGRLFMPLLYRPSMNFDFGDRLQFVDLSFRTQTGRGKEVTRRRVARRTYTCSFPQLPQDEAYGPGYRFMRTVGFDKQVFFIPDPDDVAHMQARAFFGRVSEMDAIGQAQLATGSFGLTISESF